MEEGVKMTDDLKNVLEQCKNDGVNVTEITTTSGRENRMLIIIERSSMKATTTESGTVVIEGNFNDLMGIASKIQDKWHI